MIQFEWSKNIAIQNEPITHDKKAAYYDVLRMVW